MKQLYIIPTLVFSALFAQAQMQEFTSSGVFTVPAGVTEITVEVVGAGGNGGINGSGGGGGGGYSMGTFTVSPGSTHIVTVGAGGSETATSFGMLISATAGENGTSVPNPTIGGGGAGGMGSGGTVNHSGGIGGGGYWTYFGGGGAGAGGPVSDGSDGGNTIAYTPGGCITPGGNGGAGGGAPAGDGGKGAGFTDSGCNITDPAVPGSNYGAGGGGGNGNGGGPGNGGGGYCKVTWSVTTGITSSAEEKIEVSPNPFTNHIYVQHAKGDEVYTLIGSNGQEIWKGSDITQQDFSDLSAGHYVLQVQSNDKAETVQLLKK